jgi:aspartyl aminopeptidase
METKSAWEKYTDAQMAQLTELADAYKAFISQNKTERECVSAAVDEARAAGYISLDEARAQANAGMPLAAGAKVYATQHGKACMLVHVGATPLTAGANILGAHIDSPRLDVKQNPLYEKDGFTLLDTHYYGGIKKYQWVTLPLAIHGVVAKTDGTVVPVSIGEAASDPVFCVTDLLPHLGSAQMEKNAAKVIDGEDLDLLVGNRFAPAPAQNAEGVTSDTFEDATPDATKEKVRAFTMGLLEEKYGITEADFLSAELEIVPAGPARDCGFDRSMVIGYGQDDRVCAYTSLAAQLELARTGKTPAKTAVCILVDKEEIGSVGATGMESAFFENTMAEVLELAGVTSATALRRALAASRMLSSDVSAGVDPAYSSVFESKNAAYLGHGLVFNKYTGARGKSGSNDARAEYIASLRAIMEGAGVTFQTAELGRVDAGGGGTIAYIPARFGMDVIDSGVAVLSMHSPWEVTSKADIYEAYRGYIAFLESE